MDMTTMKRKLTAKNKKVWLGVGLIGLAAVFGTGTLLLGSEDGHANVPHADAVMKAPVVTVASQTIDSVVTAAGALTSKNSSVLSSKVMGKVVYLGAHEGDQVNEGKLLMKIESGDIIAQAAQAQAAYNNAKLQYDRIKSLYDAKASTQMEMDQATLGLQTAEAGLKAARAMESYITITAPISGQIVEKRINLGEMAMPGQPVLRIEDNGHLRLETTVREQDILFIQPGKKVKVKIDAMAGKELIGTVAQVVPAADVRTHSFLVKIDVPSEKGLITGMYGKAYFSTGSREALLVPRTAVVQMSGITGVYVVNAENTAIFQMVQLGDEHGGSVEVQTGLKAGDRVVADNMLGRIEGRKIVETQK